MHRREWLALLRPGDYLIVAAAILFTLLAGRALWRGDAPTTAIVRSAGKVVARLPMDRTGHFMVLGPIGKTYIEVQPGRARVASDPGRHQYCVKQGWLTLSGATAICAPNQVTLQLAGRRPAYDSMNY